MKLEKNVVITFNLENPEDANRLNIFNNIENVVKSFAEFKDFLRTIEHKLNLSGSAENKGWKIGEFIENKYIEIFKKNGVDV